MKRIKKSLILCLVLSIGLFTTQPVLAMEVETTVNEEQATDLTDELTDKLKDAMHEIGLEGDDLGELSQDGIKKVQDLAKKGIKEAKKRGVFDRLFDWFSKLMSSLLKLLESLFKLVF